MKMKLVFLDFDGVLNSRRWIEAFHQKVRDSKLPDSNVLVDCDDALDPEAVERINQLVEKSGAKVVVSSSWRILHGVESLNAILKKAGARFEVMDTTPRTYEERGIEIQMYLDYLLSKGDVVESFVIIDDDSDMAHFLNADQFIKTAFEFGFLDWHLERALKVLT